MGDWGGDWQGPSSATSSGLVIAQSAVAVPHTGDTNEAILATIPVPPNAIGKNGRIVIDVAWSYTNSANNKTNRIRFGASGSGIGGTIIQSLVTTTSVLFRTNAVLANVNAANVQKSYPAIGALTSIYGVGSGGVTTTAIDTTAATEINITGQLALGSETITLEAYQVILYPKS